MKMLEGIKRAAVIAAALLFALSARADLTVSDFNIVTSSTGTNGTLSISGTISPVSGSFASGGSLTITEFQQSLLVAPSAEPVIPAVALGATNVTLYAGQQFAFSPAASGTAPLSYQWQKNGVNLAAQTNSALSITAAAQDDAGSYSLFVSSPFGNTASAPCLVSVIPPVATATAAMFGQFCVAISVQLGGFGYTNSPAVHIVGGGGNGATATAVVSNGVVVAINMNSAGSGYTNAPIVVIQPPVVAQPQLGIMAHTLLSFTNLAVSGNYQLQSFRGWYWTNEPASFAATSLTYTQMVAGAPANKVYRLALSPAPAQAFATPVVYYGFLVAANVTAGGSGYVSTPNVHIAGGGGSNALAVVNMSGGSVVSISILNAGYGYTNTPTLQIDNPPAASINPSYLPVMRVDSSALSPYDKYQLESMSGLLDGPWQNWGATFVPTAQTNSQWLYVTNGMGLFRVRYLP